MNELFDEDYSDIEQDVEDVLDLDADEDPIYNARTLQYHESHGTLVKPEKRRSQPYLTKYEKTRIIGSRAEQIGRDGPFMMEHNEGLNALEMAEVELYFRKVPFVVKRKMPNQRIELWRIEELSFDRIEFDMDVIKRGTPKPKPEKESESSELKDQILEEVKEDRKLKSNRATLQQAYKSIFSKNREQKVNVDELDIINKNLVPINSITKKRIVKKEEFGSSSSTIKHEDQVIEESKDPDIGSPQKVHKRSKKSDMCIPPETTEETRDREERLKKKLMLLSNEEDAEMEEIKTTEPLRERSPNIPEGQRSFTSSTPDKQSKQKKSKDLSKTSVEVIQIDSEESYQNSTSRSQNTKTPLKPVQSSSNRSISHSDLPLLEGDIGADAEGEDEGAEGEEAESEGAEGEGTEEEEEGGSPDETMELDKTTEEQKENYEIISSSEEEQSKQKGHPSSGPPKEVKKRLNKRFLESSLDNVSDDEL
ncbi:unnamed protein product [Moneuplotes crassus]|uniref:Uncharacterized protein n=1 Tax=Euplotes crassus TaxID=5936 RepID=A0AAD1UK41_EUPCR|nr:unnamed protein product [Moneuplotes crassus]